MAYSMQNAMMARNHPWKAEIVFLPIIDMPASNDTTINSTLMFIATKAKKCGFTPIVTFDQQLWWKAMQIIEYASLQCPFREMICKLGGFHTMGSFIACIGHLMDGSGLHELIDLIYAANTTPHILTGKSISRAIRAHIIVESALHIVLHEEQLSNDSEKEVLSENDLPDSTSTSKLSINHHNELRILLDEMLRGELSGNGKKMESS
ncbi:hypothetical protein DAPPUDRAFT_318926 [Daphnia pulex]|uniref:Uncharacterized protein n=1 Tax=Daphnia pulex TaxID=6669 RepID=E9GK16_DAPPU|nr:hypothetical protein DAPPUDRAFT_318926 [Daphnia pulex]|eukprot:EFX80230.1 hypothetical protein DAPPUDRAFT_318926 [Daphnia pulex]